MTEQVEIERRWLLSEPPEISLLPNPKTYKITQIYLAGKFNERVRQQESEDGSIVYTHTIKIPKEIGQLEKEEEITPEKFNELQVRSDPGHKIVLKTRTVFEFQDHKFEIDQFLHPVDFCLVEVEINSIDEEILLPDFLGKMIEVTDKKGLSNFRLSLAPKSAARLARKLLAGD